MVVSKDIYVSKSLKFRYKSILRKLRFGKFVPGVFVIFYNEASGKAEFMKSVFFYQKRLQTIRLTILGLTDTYNDAILYLAKDVAKQYDSELSVVKKEFDIY